MKVKLLRKATAIILSVCMILSLTMPTFAAKTDPIHDSSAPGWTLEDGVLTIENDAGMTDWSANRSTYANQVTEAVIMDGVNAIADNAFNKCIGLASIIIPDTVKTIGGYAFSRCTSLASITIPDEVTSIGEYAFESCILLASITLPEGVTSIEEGTFLSCSSLTSVTIPARVTSIGNNAFNVCSALKSINIPAGVETIGGQAFYYCSSLTSIILPDALKNIEPAAFQNCSGLTSVTLPAGLTAIGLNAFDSCTGLTSVTMLGTVPPTMGNGVFENSGLQNESITVPEGYAQTYKDAWGTTYADLIKPDDKGWTLEDGVLTIKTQEGMNDWAVNGRAANANNVKTVIIESGVTAIADEAFSACTKLTSVEIPSTVKRIGLEAFYSCTGLTNITIPEGVETIGNSAFYSCTGLTSINIPDTVNTIGESAFDHCANLESINIPEGVKTIESCAFNSCIKLASVTIPEGVEKIGDFAFNNCWSLTSVTIPSTVRSFGMEAFSHCTGLTSVTMLGTVPPTMGNGVFNNIGLQNESITVPEGYAQAYMDSWGEDYAGLIKPDDKGWTLVNGVLTIENDAGMTDWTANRSTYAIQVTEAVIKDGVSAIVNRAFDGCGNMTSVEIPSTVKSIGLEAFSNCKVLANIIIPEGVETIGNYAFHSCTGFTSINIPDTVNTIGKSAFYYCTNLESINIPEKVKTIESGTFNSCIKLASVTIPEGVVTIGDLAFYDCRSLTSVTIPSTVRSIGAEAFSHCTDLASITILAGVETIGESAFFNCNNLTSITIPAGVTSIENLAFYNSGITSVTMLGTTPPTMGRDVFGNSGLQNESITVPEGYAQTYMDAWGTAYADLIKPDHIHTFSEAWSSNNKYHWRAATCGHNSEIKDMAEHTWDDGTITEQATETSPGIMTYTCTVCKHTKTEEIPQLEHIHTFSEAWSSNNDYHWHASICGHHNEVKDKAEHTWDDGIVTNPATETNPGIMTYTCTVCKHTKTEEIPQIIPHEHTFSTAWSSNNEYHWHASTCGHHNEVKDKAEHTWDDGTITEQATETSPGIMTYTCTVCKHTKTEEIPQLHTHAPSADWSEDETHHWHTCSGCDEKIDLAVHEWGEGEITTEPTEDMDGVKTYTCDVCKRTRTESIPATGHTHELKHIAYVKPTCASEGTVEHYHCEKCKKNYSDSQGKTEVEVITIPIDKTNHTGGTELRGAKSATCIANGYTGDTYCLGCETVLSQGRIIYANASGHSFINGVCHYCRVLQYSYMYNPTITYLNDRYHLRGGMSVFHRPNSHGLYTDGIYQWYVCADCNHEYARTSIRLQQDDGFNDAIDIIVNDPVECGDVEMLFTVRGAGKKLLYHSISIPG